MQATNFYENKALNTLCGVTATGVAQLYIGLFLSDPTESGTAGVEVNYTNYARQPITFGAPYLDSGSMKITNAGAITWPAPDVDIGNVGYIGIFDSSVKGSGNMYLYGQLINPLILRSGQEPTMRAGDVLYYTSGSVSQWFATGILNILRNITLAAITPYAALFTALPSSGGVELSGNGYSRPAVTFTAPTQAASGHAIIQNSSLVAFPIPIAPWGSWGADTLMSAQTGGQVISAAQNSVSENITENINVQALAGSVTVSMH